MLPRANQILRQNTGEREEVLKAARNNYSTYGLQKAAESNNGLARENLGYFRNQNGV